MNKLKELETEIDNFQSIYKITDFEHFFNVYQNDSEKYFFNLNSTLIFDTQNANIKTLTLKHDMHWPLISYCIYNTTRLAWFLMKLNNVKNTEVFDIRKSGEDIKYLDNEDVQSIINSIY